jgi:adenosylmethionine-8-amino-7-oxononanoate aminotransferase
MCGYKTGKRIDADCQELGLPVRPLTNMCVMSPPLIVARPPTAQRYRCMAGWGSGPAPIPHKRITR